MTNSLSFGRRRFARLAIAAPILAKPGLAAASPVTPSPITPELVAAATKEGAVTFYAAEDLGVANGVARAFEAKYPGIKVGVERSGGEQVFQRVMQEAQAGVDAADFVTSSNRSHFIAWKRETMLAPYVTPDLASWPAAQRDPDGTYASGSGTLTLLAWNTRLVKPEDAPKRFRDLLDPKWKNRIVLAHPAYSGSILSATYAIAQMLGWGFYEQLAKQNIMQVQSGVEPPKKVAQGERQVMYGSEDTSWTLMDAGEPIAIAYPEEGTPGVAGAGGVLARSRHPSAARLFAQFFFSREGMQIVSDGGYRVFHPGVALKPGRKPLSEIKTVFIDQQELDRVTGDVKDKYAQIFGT